jgi:hypothetical protein
MSQGAASTESTPAAAPDAAAHGATAPAPNVATPTKPGQWAVPKPLGVCCVTGRQIAAGEKFFAAVRETPAGIERQDVSPGAWDQFDKTDLLASWQTVMPKAEEKKKQFVDDEVLCTLFERLGDATESAKLNFRFVLGLILMRKRLVIYEQTTRDPDGRDVWTVRMKGKTESLELIDPKLNAEQTLEVSQQLGQILNEEL